MHSNRSPRCKALPGHLRPVYLAALACQIPLPDKTRTDENGVVLGHLGTAGGWRADLVRDERDADYVVILTHEVFGRIVLTVTLTEPYLRVTTNEMPDELVELVRLKMYLPHPLADHELGRRADRRVHLHRLLAALWFGVCLSPNGKRRRGVAGMDVDHINRIKRDNRLVNLQPMTQAAHAEKTRAEGGEYTWETDEYNARQEGWHAAELEEVEGIFAFSPDDRE